MPKRQYYGAQTEKAISNFPFDFRKTHREVICAIVEIKKAAARAHAAAKKLDAVRARAIVRACDEILKGKHDDQFILPSFQGGMGTSNHMNVNEVVADRASEFLAHRKSSEVRPQGIHPNDHVNMSHSTNDVMPSALKIASLRLVDRAIASTEALIAALDRKGTQFAKIQKLGRTHMQDAVPMTLGGEFTSYAETIRRRQKNMREARAYLVELNLGGSAVGNSINVSSKYRKLLYKELQKVTKLPIKPARNLVSQTASVTDFLVVSQALVALCTDLSKIAGDFRILSSGPKGGIGELILPELQAGSSIMPGKVNPVLPEALSQLYYLVSGNNATIEKACEGSQLELGVMMPVITDRLVESLKLSAEMIEQFARKCVAIAEANRSRIKEHLEKSTAYATLLNPVIGYDKAAECVKEAIVTGKTLRDIVLEKKLLTPVEFDRATKR
ncbi:aspartate ammonia-lyase [Candidatus Kaiserbacteria bacterium]|nr:aspartate ammonia-lyase [Candidatus Kaiserbacteria bacterium]